MIRQRVLIVIAASILVCSVAAGARGQSQDTTAQAQPAAPAQPAKKKGILDKLNAKLKKANEKLDQIKAAANQQTGATAPAPTVTETPPAATTVTPDPPATTVTTAGDAAAVPPTVNPAAETPASVTLPEPAGQSTAAPAAPVQPNKKKGFLDKLNDKLKQANEKLDKVNAAAKKQVGGAQP